MVGGALTWLLSLFGDEARFRETHAGAELTNSGVGMVNLMCQLARPCYPDRIGQTSN